MGIFDGFLKQLATGDTVKDYKHASKLFVDNNYALAPKYDWLYHVFFDVSELSEYSRQPTELTETGMLVKSVDLPSFGADVSTLNNYNRPEIVQTKLRYGGITITFHDDSSDVVRNFWFDYMNHYYRDTDLGYSDRSGTVDPAYKQNTKYLSGQRDKFNNFGYDPRNTNTFSTPNYLHAIRIYSLHQKRFTEYTLVNPIITNFSHGSHNASGGGILQNVMSIEFTTVLYASGYVSADTVMGFADLHYDKSPSPLTPAGGGTNSILGPGGILSAVDSITGEAGKGNYGGAAFTAFRAFQKNKNADLKGLAKAELVTGLKDILSGQDPRNRFFIPQSGGLSNLGQKAKDVFNGVRNGTTGVAAAGSVSSNNASLNSLGSAPTSLSGKVAGTPSVASGINLLGTTLSTGGTLAGAPLNKTVNMEKTSPTSGSGLTNAYSTSKTTSVRATSTSTTPTFSGFAGAIAQIAKNLEEKAQSLADQAKRAVTGNPQISAGAAKSALTTFQSGTNNIVGQASSALKQTPFGSSVVQAIGPDGLNNVQSAINLAGSEAQNFIKNGNFQNVSSGTATTGVYNPYSGSGLTNAYATRSTTSTSGKSTNPAPATTGINLSGDIPS